MNILGSSILHEVLESLPLAGPNLMLPSFPEPVSEHPPLERLSLIPLSNAVHFPRTELTLEVVEPRYRRLVEEIFARAEARSVQPWVGTVLLKPDPESPESESSDPRLHRLEAGLEAGHDSSTESFFDAGTAARLIDVRAEKDRCEIDLRGEYRFTVDREIDEGPCREAWVHRIDEPSLSEFDPDVQVLRYELLRRTVDLARELGERFALDVSQVRQLHAALPFEAMVNHLAANMDVAVSRKLQLLRVALPDRALHLLTILRSRQQILDVLRPYRHLARAADRN